MGHLAIMDMLLSSGANPNLGIRRRGMYPLEVALEGKKLEAVALLRERDVSAQGVFSLWPFMGSGDFQDLLLLSVERKDLTFLDILLWYGVNPEGYDLQKLIPMFVAWQKGWTEGLEAIVKKVAETLWQPNSKSWKKLRNSLSWLATDNKKYHGDQEFTKFEVSVVRALTKLPKRTNWTQPNHEPLVLLWAARTGRLDTAKSILCCGPTNRSRLLEVIDDRGHTPLVIAVVHGQLNICSYFLDLGANIEARNPAGYTPLALACNGNNIDISRILLDRGALTGLENVEQTLDDMKKTALWVATK
ncbi:ankyrin repeat-containing domain protein [Podospora fimiseda]|uniref:Ankyrin repeat-containing domain protein n=1 Tax=Podospora fimiseda TaxID=252190 RepID=A0AAN6YLI8_9PEZI|nr:ankyrin repeat-containing domain protein [Podospora fimiseda]